MAGKITIIGLGAGDLSQMTLGIYETIMKAGSLLVRTDDHPAVQELRDRGISIDSYDSVYEKHDSFEPVYEEIAADLRQRSADGDVLYAVPGHPLVAEQTVQLLLHQSPGIEIDVLGGKSFLDEMYTALRIDPIEGCQILDGTALVKETIQIRSHLIIVQVYDAYIASDVKLTLMEKYSDDHTVYVVTAAGSASEKITATPLYELDQAVELNNLTALYIPPVKKEEQMYRDFDFLRGVIAALRAPGGCPWDQKQTHSSLKKYLIEEAYEVLEAIDEEDDDHLAEELGDVLLQVLLHAQIGEEEGYFSIDDVIENTASKMIRRHPHVFGTADAKDADEVLANWEEIKKQEKGKETRESLLDGISKGLPSLMKAFSLQKKAAKVGFDWPDEQPVWDKISEELQEFKEAASDDERLKEMGDILFAVVNLARFNGIDPEEALQATNRKFFNRFRFIENELEKAGKTPEDSDLQEMDDLWNKAKEIY
ncbi:nucleoside triphosphate pyrophosphohydrolase [Fictibacillus aquaticus]|uniref:Nucleoside triphosphate pyrophosphohydrolase n=1 Tax=Fictibacillus aquaticus TaxID=2021314 RepID=A0A235F6Q2_9BACL|nr:nucleoside triphosphate pyrophosphohydrolase [Fictibacillus aquaticus]OYD56996.1 nucleoside triphosphate pyrophosphohydrolase [Fictibacillus aquaticus]